MAWRRTAIVIACLTVATLPRCTGDENAASAQEHASKPLAGTEWPLTPFQQIHGISKSIPIYPNSSFRDDLSRQDLQTFRTQYGADTITYTFGTDDAFPQVWHYYVTYLSQYRDFKPMRPFPPENQKLRTIEIPLNKVMQDPFIPGEAYGAATTAVVLQVVETDSDPRTIIRYVVKPTPVADPQVRQ